MTKLQLRNLALFLFVSSIGHGALAQDDCAPKGGQNFICGAINPEDLVQVPGTNWVISSGMAEGAGFYLIDGRSGSLSILPFTARHDASFANCPTPPVPATFNSHGLNIRATTAGRARLNVVGHGAREAIEIFDVDISGAQPTLTWVGCVVMPDGLVANSVASFANGKLLATVLFTSPDFEFADSVVGRNTGAVYEWSPGQRGFTLIEGSELPANNGIEVSADGSEFFVVSSGLQTVVAFAHSNPTRQLRTTRALPFTPDNVHMGSDGLLYTAGMENDVPECGGPPGPQHSIPILASCPRGSMGAAIDPASMADRIVVQTDATPEFSNATMVLPIGNEGWMGTFAGNRISRAPLL